MIDPLTFIALLPAVVLVVYICRKAIWLKKFFHINVW